MIAWALVLYYLAFYAIPWEGRPGYRSVLERAPAFLPGPPWLAFTLGMALGFGACVLVAAGIWSALARDDRRWGGVGASIGGTGWLRLLDPLLGLFLIGALVFALRNEVPLHGVLAAILPAALALGTSALSGKTPPPPPATEDADAPEPPALASIAFEPLIDAARRHAGESTPRDTMAHDARFEPPTHGVTTLAEAEPLLVSWIVPRAELEAALADAPSEPFSGTRPAVLVRAIGEGARARTVSFLAERIAGPGTASPEDRVARLLAFAENHLEPVPPAGRPRLPLATLAEARADAREATVLVTAMALGLGLPVALWTAGEAFGLALEGLPATSPVLTGPEHVDPATNRRYVLLGSADGNARVHLLSAPFRRQSEGVPS